MSPRGSRLQEEEKEIIASLVSDGSERQTLELDFVKKNTVLASKHRECETIKRDLLFRIRDSAIVESKRKRILQVTNRRA